MEDKKIVSDVTLQLMKGKGSTRTLALGHFTLGKKIRINCSVVRGNKGIFVGLPQHPGKDRKTGGTKYFSDVWVEDEDWHKQIQEAVIAKYKEMTAGENNGDSGENGDSCPW